MANGKLFETDRPLEKWVFLDPETGIYLAGFGTAESAVEYGSRNGYDVSQPYPQVRMAEIDAAQPAEEYDIVRELAEGGPKIPKPNSPIPDLRAMKKPATTAKPTGGFVRRGFGSLPKG